VREKAKAIVDAAVADPDGEYLFERKEQYINKPTVTTEGNVIKLRFGND
jgi:hypothetical protein